MHEADAKATFLAMMPRLQQRFNFPAYYIIITYKLSLVPSLHSRTSQALQVSKIHTNRFKTNYNLKHR